LSETFVERASGAGQPLAEKVEAGLALAVRTVFFHRPGEQILTVGPQLEQLTGLGDAERPGLRPGIADQTSGVRLAVSGPSIGTGGARR